MNEAQAILRENKLPIKKALATLLDQARQTIRLAATLNRSECFYAVPSVCLECPVQYGHAKMTRSLCRILGRAYTCSYTNNVVHVAW